MVNGVVVNENLRGQANALFIEDGADRQQQRVAGAVQPVHGDARRGVHWKKAASFGQPLTRFACQMPRTWPFSVGLKFRHDTADTTRCAAYRVGLPMRVDIARTGADNRLLVVDRTSLVRRRD